MYKRTIITLALAGCLGLVQAENNSNISSQSSTRADSIRAELLNPEGSEIIIVAHWGDWHGTFENSLHSIQKAVEKGAKAVLMQVQKTKDGQLICFSEQDISRLMNGEGNVSDLTLEQLRAIPVKEYRGSEEMVIIPTVKEAIEYSKDKILLELSSDEYLDELQQIVKETASENVVIFNGTNAPQQGLMFIPIVNLDSDFSLDELLSLNPVAVELRYSSDDNANLQPAYDSLKGKCRVCINTQTEGYAGSHVDVSRGVNPDDVWGVLIRQGATVFVTDQIKPFLRYLNPDSDPKHKNAFPPK